MKVTISYAVDLEDVPKTVCQLLENLNKEMAMVQICIDPEPQGMLKEIDMARQQLAKIDMSLMDYASILAGYIKADADIKTGVDITQQTPEGVAQNDQSDGSDSSEPEG